MTQNAGLNVFERSNTRDIDKWLKANSARITDHSDLGFSVGDRIKFLNGYGVLMNTVIIGFDKDDGRAYLHWDCYWSPICLINRKACKID